MSENPPRKRETLPSAWIFGAKLQQKFHIRKKKDKKKRIFIQCEKKKRCANKIYTTLMFIIRRSIAGRLRREVFCRDGGKPIR